MKRGGLEHLGLVLVDLHPGLHQPEEPRQRLRRGRQKAISPQGSGFQKLK